jgi:AraC-like DNA-binding protein
MIVNIPDYLHKNKELDTLRINNLTFLKYNHRNNLIKMKCNLETNLLLIVLSGTKIITSNEGKIIADKGTIVFIRKGRYVMSEIVDMEQNGYESLGFFMDDDYLYDFAMKNIDLLKKTKKYDNENNIKIIKMDSFIKSCIESIFPFFIYHNSYEKDLLRMKFDEIFLNILNNDKNNKFKSILTRILNTESANLITFMENNFTKPYNIEFFAKESGRSITKFKTDFKNIFGTPPKIWITQKRLEKAHFLLKNSDDNITEIAYLVGINNISNFIKLFKDLYGITPKQLQKKAKSDIFMS